MQLQALKHDLTNLANALLNDIESVLKDLPETTLNTTPPGFTNTPYTIMYHLLGSAQYWIADVVGGTPSNRNREEEFNRTGTKQDLQKRLSTTRTLIQNTLNNLNTNDLNPHPPDLSKGVLSWGTLPPQGRTNLWVITHDLCHIAYHLGQLKLIQKQN